MRFDAPTGSTYETLMLGAERRVITGTLERYEGSQSDAAAALGVSIRFLVSRSKKLDIGRKRPAESKPRTPLTDTQLAGLAAGRALRWASKKGPAE